MKEENLIKLIMELGVLARQPRTGPYHVGLKDHETPASHSFRASALAYFLAEEEGADTGKVLKMCMIHDFPETRLLDQTFIQKEFYDTKDKMEEALEKQLRGLKGSGELRELFRELQEKKSKEAHVVHDADVLESLVEAREYIQQGIRIMEVWFLDKRESLKTATGKKLFDVLKKGNIYWWK